jgi:hypothetical protein
VLAKYNGTFSMDLMKVERCVGWELNKSGEGKDQEKKSLPRRRWYILLVTNKPPLIPGGELVMGACHIQT